MVVRNASNKLCPRCLVIKVRTSASRLLKPSFVTPNYRKEVCSNFGRYEIFSKMVPSPR